MKTILVYFFASMLMVSQNGFSKDTETKIEVVSPSVAEVSETPYLPLNNQDYYEKFVSDVKKSPRVMASAHNDIPALEASFEKDFLKMRDELIGNKEKNIKGITNMNELDKIINFYSNPAEYAKLSNQAKFLALQLRALRPFKGFIFRAKLYISGISATRTMIVTALRAQIAGIQAFFPVSPNNPVNHWEVVFKYLTENVEGIGSEIKTDEDLHKFFKEVANQNLFVLNDFGRLFLSNGGKPLDSFKPIWWDNKLYASFATFSGRDRYVALGMPEMFALYSGMNAAMSSLYSTTAYSFAGLQSSIKSMGELFGVDNPIQAVVGHYIDGKGAQGMSSYTRIAVLNKHPRLFSSMPDYKDRMSMAYDFLVTSIRSARISYELTKRLPADVDNLFDPRIANGLGRIGDIAFYNADNLVSERVDADKKEIAPSAVVLSEKIKMTLKNFYLNPPAHLNELYPTNWDLTSKGSVVNVPGYSSKGRNLRNYKYGMANEWNLTPYQKLFPELTGYANPKKNGVNSTKDIPKFSRILAQTWGSSVFAIPLGAAIF